MCIAIADGNGEELQEPLGDRRAGIVDEARDQLVVGYGDGRGRSHGRQRLGGQNILPEWHP